MFLCVSITDREHFTFEDWSLIVGVFCSVLLGFFMLFKQPFAIACVLLLCSCLLYCYVCMLIYRLDTKLRNSIREAEQSRQLYGTDLDFNRRRSRLCRTFLYVVTLHVVVYLVAVTGLIDHNTTLVGLLISDVWAKLFVTVAATEEHADVLNPLVYDLIQERTANEARREFLRYIFHEVRVPLNTVTMGIEILSKSEGLSSTEQDTVLMMDEASRFMGETLNAVLTMQKIEQGKLELHMKPFRIVERLNAMVNTFEGTAKACLIEIKRDIRVDSDIYVLGDSFQLDHVTANILSNAIKFSKPHSTITVIIEENGRSVEENIKTRNIKVSVRDEGPGITKEDIAKLFTPFVQIRPGELQQGRGTGIGLSICKQIVKLHGGDISCESEVGVGSVFSYTVCFEEVMPEVVHDESFDIEKGMDGNAIDENEEKSCWASDITGHSSVGVSVLGERLTLAPRGQDYSKIGDVLVVDGRSDRSSTVNRFNIIVIYLILSFP